METHRTTIKELETILGVENRVLDHGFVRLIDYMGGDESIVQAARVSYGKGTRRVSEDRGLIRYLLRHRHTTPFEMCEIKFHVKLPIFVARQWIRHRTANVNEYSARYSILDKEFYVPDVVAEQSKTNNQGRGSQVSPEESRDAFDVIRESSEKAYLHYMRLLNIDEEGATLDPSRQGVARELARMVLPTNFYTQWYWKIDLHNLFHFLALRTDQHAQLEIREYANCIAEITKQWVPLAFEAFEDYVSKGISLSSDEGAIIAELLREVDVDALGSLTNRERDEFRTKFGGT